MRQINTVVLWVPRALAIAFAFFLAMLASDVYLQGNDFWQTSQAFFQHLIPAFGVLVILIIGWHRDALAAIGYMLLAVAYFIALSGWRDVGNALMLTLPPLGISLAFYARLRLLRLLDSRSND